ncbi:MAG: adenylate/guanylate cyclase domain-containing protein [Alphaproteobacteria bacterium]|nr:adenylate/guanylate cyclase domain-containing protein [Alphaproteobacteria bacterium]
MAEPNLVRRLTTIMDIDVVGFSTMSARDEEHALGLLGSRLQTAQRLIGDRRGRVFKLTGDGLLAEFASPVEAVRAALEIQEAMRSANGRAEPNDQLMLRIGVNLGDVVESGSDLLGDAVNVAARLEAIADPDGVCVSAAVYEQIEGKLALAVEDIGEQHVKNIPRAIHAYRLATGEGRPKASSASRSTSLSQRSRLPIAIGTIAVVSILALAGGWLLHKRTDAGPPPLAAAATPLPATAVASQPSLPRPPATATLAPVPNAGPASVARIYSAEDVPFVPDWRRRRLEEYAQAEDAKALAINVRGWFGMTTRRIDFATARREALQECKAAVEREVRIPREFDHCMIYAVGNDVVWSFRPPVMPPPPYVPAAKLSPPVKLDPATVPLVAAAAHDNIAEHYMKSTRPRALVLGRGHFEWSSPSDTATDAIRRNLQICGHIRGRPCLVYAVEDQVIVRVPRTHRAVDIVTPQDFIHLDSAQRAAIEHYLIADDWRAIAMASNGHIGIVSARASEAAAVADALAECARLGGIQCKVISVGPFLVAPQ